MSMASLSHCRITALPPARPERRHSSPPRFSRAPLPDRPAPAPQPAPGRSRFGEGALNLGLAALTIAGVAAFYGLLMLTASQIAMSGQRSPYADFYTGAANPWSQPVIANAPISGAPVTLTTRTR